MDFGNGENSTGSEVVRTDDHVPVRKRELGKAGAESRSILSLLVIDDDPAFCRLAARSVDDFAEVRFRFGVPEAGTLDIEGYDCILLDYRLPVRDGIEILTEIREISSTIPVLFLTGYGDPDLARQALKRGANSFLAKPIEIRRLREAIEDACERSQSNPVQGAPTSGLRSNVAIPEYPENAQEFSAMSDSGRELAGTVARFGFRSVFVDLPMESRCERGEQLRHVEFRFGDQTLDCGVGRVGQISRSSSEAIEVEIILSGLWGVVLSERQGESELLVRKGGRSFLGDSLLEDWSELTPQFRLAVNELAESLDALQHACAEVSTGSGAVPIESYVEENQIVSELGERYSKVFWDAVIRFEDACGEVGAKEHERIAKSYARRVLYPFVLASPFLARVVERPIGVPGDFGMLGQILGNPLEGYDLYGRVLNSWILSCGAASAYRYRVELLHREIVGTVERVCTTESRPAKILSMASGVAYEIQRFIEHPPEIHEADFTLVDFSEVTLNEARRQYSLLGELPDGTKIDLHRSSVIDLANRSRGLDVGGAEESFVPEEDYDLVYCAGLFDYLSDRLIIRVTRYLFGLLGENGKLVVSNFTFNNPIRSWMTYVMDWELIYRSEEQFEALVLQAVGEQARMERETDPDGVEAYVLVRK